MTNSNTFSVLPYPRKVHCKECGIFCGLEKKDGSGPYLSNCLKDGRENAQCTMSLSLVHNRPRDLEGRGQ